MRFRFLHDSLCTSLSFLVVPIERPTRYQTTRSRRHDLLLLNAQFQICQDMRFRFPHDFKMRKHDKCVATYATDTPRCKIAHLLQTRK